MKRRIEPSSPIPSTMRDPAPPHTLHPCLVQVLLAVRESPLSPCCLVFGSMARGEPVPGDLDLLVILPGLRSPNVGTASSYRPLCQLLAIVAHWPGCFDPFVWNGRWLWVRDDTSTRYVASLLRPVIGSILAQAVPFATVLEHYLPARAGE
jgi:hypothetical protein